MFDVWMHEVSDLVQQVAVAYGERMSIEETFRVVSNVSDEGVR
jgi:hypothetical protein